MQPRDASPLTPDSTPGPPPTHVYKLPGPGPAPLCAVQPRDASPQTPSAPTSLRLDLTPCNTDPSGYCTSG